MDIALTSPWCFAYRGMFNTVTFLLFPLAITLLISWPVLAFFKRRSSHAIPRFTLVLNAIAMYGTCLGVIVGFAKDHVSTISLPIPITLLGMLAVYLLSHETWKSYQAIAPQAALILSMSVAFGFFYSASAKPIFDLIDLDTKLTKYEVEKLVIDAQFEYMKRAMEGKSLPELDREFARASSNRFRFAAQRCAAS